MNRIIFPGLLLLTLLIACRNNTSDHPEAAGGKENKEQVPSPSTASLKQLYPSLPADTMAMLYQAVDYIDFVFYYADFSMNQSDDASVKATLAHVSAEVPGINPACQPIGSLFFQSKGKELIQAELYYTDQCIYFVWLVKGKRSYANKMTPNGFRFYEQIFKQANPQN